MEISFKVLETGWSTCVWTLFYNSFYLRSVCLFLRVCVFLCVYVCVCLCAQVGESNRPSFRPGLEGGSSDDEASSGRGGPSLSGIEHRRSAEGQVINPPVTGTIRPSLVSLSLSVLCEARVTIFATCPSCRRATPGDGGGGDGSSGSEESGNDGGVATIPLTGGQTAYDVLRGVVGSSEGERGEPDLPGHGRSGLSRHAEVSMRLARCSSNFWGSGTNAVERFSHSIVSFKASQHIFMLTRTFK